MNQALAIALSLLGIAGRAVSQDPAISHDPLSCLVREDYPVVDARIEPGPEVRTAKVYFRAEQFEDFYYVEMQVLEGGRPDDFLGLLPMPSPGTTRILYYIEAIDDAFNGNRSIESAPAVEEGCKRRPAAAYFTGKEPGIIVGATKAGMSALPPGFSAAGIVGFITSTGVATGVGGGAGVGVAVGAGVAAAGAAATAVAVGNSGSGTSPSETAPPQTPPSAPSTPSPTPSPAPLPPPPPAIPVDACFQTQPDPPTIAPGESVRFEASCSTGEALLYEWDFGGAAEDKEGRVVSVLFTTPGSYSVTLTVTDAHGNRDSVTRLVVVEERPPAPSPPAPVPPGPAACFNATVTGCSVSYDASCSRGSIVSYDWVINDGGAFGGPFSRSGMTLNENYPGCDAETLNVTLSVSDGATTNSTNKTVALPPAVTACFNANVSGCSVTLNAGCSTGLISSYSWLIDDGGAFGGPRNRTGVTVTENFAGCSGESLTVTLTVSGGAMNDTQTSTVTLGSSPVSSCFVYAGKLNSCVHEWNASCSSGAIVTYTWRVDTTAQLPAGTLTFVKVTPDLVVDWNPIGGCSGAPAITVELTVMDILTNTDVSTQSGFVIDLKSDGAPERLSSRFTSHLGAGGESRGLSGIVLAAERSDPVDDRGPHLHTVNGIAGRNVVEAFLVSEPRGETIWKFDFTGAEHFVPGSLRAERGQVLASTDRTLAFRLSSAGERVRFWFELRP